MITSQTIIYIAPVVAVIATIIGATWVLLDKIGEVRIELHRENAETRENVKIVETKIDEFKKFHEREHDLFYSQGGQ